LLCLADEGLLLWLADEGLLLWLADEGLLLWLADDFKNGLLLDITQKKYLI